MTEEWSPGYWPFVGGSGLGDELNGCTAQTLMARRDCKRP